METVLNLSKPKTKIEVVYNIDSIDDLFIKIKYIIKNNQKQNYINIQNYNNLNIKDLIYKYGFNVITYNNMRIQFKGYTRWVYFKNNKAIRFDNSGSGTDTPSHLCGFIDDTYINLDFDRFEKIEI